ncbi:DUF5694 domain-containing protein [Polaribacter septentrionalilitoris]|uniref:DUF5694 domain-containing protein n=1 Tax=Polaribacter septentrionalilitoris TaxID=2494657 RepID=UPI00135A7CBB|nr:DUF5694 domain-containing protein [Polaribacter septentrionalilitoris]
MKNTIKIICFLSFFSCHQKETNLKNKKAKENPKLKVLLFGTYHFENFNSNRNADLVKVNVNDVLTDRNQKELKSITDKISNFNPDKIFIEYPFSKQKKLDSLYSNFTATNYSKVKRNENYQVGFRVAKNLQHKNIYGYDLRTNFPADSLFKQMEKAKQFELLRKDSLELDKIERSENELFSSNKTLLEILCYYNDAKRRKEDINWYVNLANQGGEKENFVGAYLASEWYRRNLYMYAIIQKAIEEKDDRILIISGASHIAMFKEFIDYNPEWKTVELLDIMQ